MKIIIIGGVAAGASAAARLRRLNENAEIILMEKGKYISYANCGLPYHLGGVIPERKSLLVMSSQNFAERFNIEVRTENEVIAIDPDAKFITVKNSEKTYQESYDKLLIATGSTPLIMDLPGFDSEKVKPFWNIPDMDAAMAKLDESVKKVVVIGAGFIGLEVAENLKKRNLDVTVVELAPQVLPTMDEEMSFYAAQELLNHQIKLKLGRKVVKFEQNCGFSAVLDNGETLNADLVMMCVGVRPNSILAKNSGLQLGERGHIVVNANLQTSNPDIYAAGDVIEITDPVSGRPAAVPLAGPANKQGRIAADNLSGIPSVYPGSFGTSVIKIGNLTAASTGLTERRLKMLNLDYLKIYTHPGSNASYYPGGAMLHLKLLFAPDGKILGAQAIGVKGADKRIDVISTAMQAGKTAPELAALELAYAPPYNSAKDPVNFLGMIAQNILNKLTSPVYADAIPDGTLLDVREVAEYTTGSIPNAVNLPLGQLRTKLNTLDKNQFYIVFCQVGLRGYVAERILKQHGFKCANLSGGFLTWKTMHTQLKAVEMPTAPSLCGAQISKKNQVLDVRAMACPGPVVRLKNAVDDLPEGAELEILSQMSFAPDLTGWIKSCGHELLAMTPDGNDLKSVIRKSAVQKNNTAASATKNQDAAIILFSNDLDKALAGLIVACGMAASGGQVTIFFTFWGLSVLRKNPAPQVKKSLIGKMFGMMLPKGAGKLALSKMNMAGMGATMMKNVMAKENVPSLNELLLQARQLGIKFIACEMAMNVMGLTREELLEVDEVAGVASFSAIAKEAGTTLFI